MIEAVKAKLELLKPSLPPGVEVVTVYDRTSVIERAVANLTEKLAEEFGERWTTLKRHRELGKR